jgi:hypothetical protein
MIAARRLQRSFADGFIAEASADLGEAWMRQADQIWVAPRVDSPTDRLPSRSPGLVSAFPVALQSRRQTALLNIAKGP